MKIYEHFDVSSPENLENSYIETLKKLLDALEENERNPINQRINYNIFKNFYIEKNPIPTLVDDLSKLDYKTEHYKGKDYKVIEILQENNLGLSTHSFVPNSILNIEALEIVDPKFFLSVAQKGKGNMSEQWITDKETYKLYVKPRLGNDLWVQAPINIGSGHGSLKNIHHIQTNYKNKRAMKDYFGYIPELIKKELDLSLIEYGRRMKKLRNCTTLDEIKQKDAQMEKAIRKVLRENEVFEGLVRPEIMAIGIPENTSLSQVNPHILSYVDRHPECRLVRIVEPKITLR